jgi:hypothetical protein
MVQEVDEARRALAIHRASRPRESEVDFAHRLARALDGRRD